MTFDEPVADPWLKSATIEARERELAEHVLAVLRAIDVGEPFYAHPAALESARHFGYLRESGGIVDFTEEGRAWLMSKSE